MRSGRIKPLRCFLAERPLISRMCQSLPVHCVFVATRTNAGKLEDLIEATAELEEIGRLIQDSDKAAAAEAHAKLDSRYRAWYVAALAALPQDLHQKFRSEFEGSLMHPRIEKFLGNPLMPWAFYDSYSPEQREKYGFSSWQHPYGKSFQTPLIAQRQLLMEALARFDASTATLEGLALLEQLTRRLPVAFAVLRQKAHSRPGIEVVDEYDVQRILHAVLVLHFDEVEPEDPTPRMAGASSRLDFLLRRERIAVETKMMRDSLSLRELRKELAEDMLYFRRHPDAGALFIFIYDPDRKITNAAGFEAQLRTESDEFPVRVVVAT